MKDNEKNNTIQKKRLRQLQIILIRFFVLGIFLFLINTFFGTFRVIHNNDMYPLLADGQGVIISKIGKTNINDVVLYEVNGEEKFGRVIAQKGDMVNITQEGLYINGNISYNSLPYKTLLPDEKDIEIKIPEGSYYILNDYRERMTDSRTFGCISDIKGTVIFTMKYREI